MPELGSENQNSSANWKTNRAIKLTLISVAIVAWFYVTYRFWQFEPTYTLRFVVFSCLAVVIFFLGSKFLTRKGTSLRALVIGGPIAIALFTIPMRSAVYHRQLLDHLARARVEEFSLGNTNAFYQFLQRHVTTVLGSTWGDSFSNELNTLRLDLNLIEPEQILRLPTDHVSLLSIKRGSLPGATITREFVDWMNACPDETVVNLNLESVAEPELTALSLLRHSINVTLQQLPTEDTALQIPSVSHLTLKNVNFDSWRPKNLELTSMQRLRLEECQLTASNSFTKILEQSKRISLRSSEIDASALELILQKPMNHLSLNRVTLPDSFNQPTSVDCHFLTLWDCTASPEKVLEMIVARNAKELQLYLSDPFSIEQFKRLVEFPQVRFIRMTAPWLTKEHAMPLMNLAKSMQIVIFDSRMPIEDEEWIKANVAAEIQLRIQRDPVSFREIGN